MPKVGWDDDLKFNDDDDIFGPAAKRLSDELDEEIIKDILGRAVPDPPSPPKHTGTLSSGKGFSFHLAKARSQPPDPFTFSGHYTGKSVHSNPCGEVALGVPKKAAPPLRKKESKLCKCGRQMVQLFTSWACDACDPPNRTSLYRRK